MSGGPPASADIWRIHGELIRIEAHWSGQVRDQQQRLATVIGANGFLLGFLGSAGLIGGPKFANLGSARIAFVAALLALTLALIIGAVALLPRRWLPISEAVVEPASLEEAMAQVSQHRQRDEGGYKPRPRIDPTLYWLDSRAIWRDFRATSELNSRDDWLQAACEALVWNQQGNVDHLNALRLRGFLMNIQLALIGVGATLLFVVLCTRL